MQGKEYTCFWKLSIIGAALFLYTSSSAQISSDTLLTRANDLEEAHVDSALILYNTLLSQEDSSSLIYKIASHDRAYIQIQLGNPEGRSFLMSALQEKPYEVKLNPEMPPSAYTFRVENLQHQACNYFSHYHEKNGDIDSAIYYLYLGDTLFSFNTFCGNMYASYEDSKTNRLIELYEKKGDTNGSIDAMLDVVFRSFDMPVSIIFKLKSTVINDPSFADEVRVAVENVYEKKETNYSQFFISLRNKEIPIDPLINGTLLKTLEEIKTALKSSFPYGLFTDILDFEEMKESYYKAVNDHSPE